jgi:hypothetical protein
MVVSSHPGAQTPIQQILRTTAQHFAISPEPQTYKPTLAMFASEFKDPLPLRWKQTPRQTTCRQFHAADLVTLRELTCVQSPATTLHRLKSPARDLSL